MPVPTIVRSPGGITASVVVTRSAPASPGRAYDGTGTPGSSRVSRTSTLGTTGETTLGP